MSDSAHKEIFGFCNGQGLPALAICLLLVGCGMNPRHVDPIQSTRTFASLDCAHLASEKSRIEAAYVPIRWSNQHGVREEIGRLNGEAAAVDAAAQEKQCGLPPVAIPSYPHKAAHG